MLQSEECCQSLGTYAMDKPATGTAILASARRIDAPIIRVLPKPWHPTPTVFAKNLKRVREVGILRYYKSLKI